MSLVHTFYFPPVFSRWCDQCEPVKGAFILGESKNGFMISDHQDSSLPKTEDPKKDHLPWQHHVPVFLVLQTASNPSFARKSGREESIWAAKSRELRRRARSLLVLRKMKKHVQQQTDPRREEKKKSNINYIWIFDIYIQLDVHRQSQDSVLLPVKERNRPVGELLKSWVHGCLIQACFVGHRKGDPLFS